MLQFSEQQLASQSNDEEREVLRVATLQSEMALKIFNSERGHSRVRRGSYEFLF